jgi:hypothetical protein
MWRNFATYAELQKVQKASKNGDTELQHGCDAPSLSQTFIRIKDQSPLGGLRPAKCVICHFFIAAISAMPLS